MSDIEKGNIQKDIHGERARPEKKSVPDNTKALVKKEEKELKLKERNINSIRISYHRVLKRNNEAGISKPPSISEIAEDTGLNWKTVKKHIEGIRTEVTGNIVGQIMFDEVLQAVANCAVKGDMKAAQLFFTVMGAIGRDSGGSGPAPGTPAAGVPTIGEVKLQVNKTYIQNNNNDGLHSIAQTD